MKHDSTTRKAMAVRPFLSRYRAELLCALMLALMAVNFLSVIAHKSITVDEMVMTPAGYYHLTEGDFRPVNEHPPFAKVLGALPLLFTGTLAPPLDPQAPANYDYYLDLFRDFWRANYAHYEQLAFWSRVPMVCVALLLGLLVFVYAQRLFGPRAALFAVALYALEPTVLAHGRVVQTDIPSAFAYLIFSFALYDYIRAPNVRRACYVGLAAGLAVVTKFSMVVLGPVLVFVAATMFLFARRRGQRRAALAGQSFVIALAAVLAVNAAYFFHHREPDPYNLSLRDYGFSERTDELLRPPLETAHLALQKIFPPDLVSGINWQLAHNRDGHPAGIMGLYSRHGWWYYFPVAFALKTTLPFLLLSLASIVWALWMLSRRAEGRWLVLLVPLALFTGLVMLSSINIGVRYFLPAYPFLFILSGALLDWLLRQERWRAGALALVVGALCWTGLEAARAYPNYMSYMNQLASRAPHWWYLSDSNVEWGDEVRNLALYLRERGERGVGAVMFNWQILEAYGIEQAIIFVPPGTQPEEARYVAIGASYLNGSTVPEDVGGIRLTESQRANYFDEYRRRTPEKIFGGSIYLYRMKE